MKRFELTKEQKALVEKYNEIICEMRKADIKFVSRYPDELAVFNGSEIEYFNWPDCEEKNDVKLKLEDGVYVINPTDKALLPDDKHFFAHLKENNN